MFDFLAQLLDWIYQKRCYFCKEVSQDNLMCSQCYNAISFLEPVSIKTFEDHKIYSATKYHGQMKALIRAIKYHNKKALAKEAGMVLADFWGKVKPRDKEYVVVPMPLYRKRQKDRGYNQSELIASQFAKHFGYVLNCNLASRIKETPPLYKKKAQERADILMGAFKVNLQSYCSRPILIIDDICTTGSSSIELIKEFKASGVDDITVLTCCCT